MATLSAGQDREGRRASDNNAPIINVGRPRRDAAPTDTQRHHEHQPQSSPSTTRRQRYLLTPGDAEQLVARYAALDLLVLDEVGYVRLDARGAELLFQIITAREERASIACASNAPFSEWGTTFTDPRLAAAVVDRLTFNAHIINTGTSSYRLRTSRANRANHQQPQPISRGEQP